MFLCSVPLCIVQPKIVLSFFTDVSLRSVWKNNNAYKTLIIANDLLIY